MLDDALYVPVLRWKQAEKGALQWLRERDKSRLKPLLEITPPSFQAKDGRPGPSVRDVLATIAQDIERCGVLRRSLWTLITRSMPEFENRAVPIFWKC